MADRRIWSETVPWEELARPRVIQLLQRFALTPLVAVRPADLARLESRVAVLQEAGLQPALWPMLDDSEGRWANASNLDRFLSFCGEVLQACGDRVPAELALDLEPSIDWVRPLTEGRWPALPRGETGAFVAAQSRLRAFVVDLRARGIEVSAAAVPLTLDDAADRSGWQRLLSTPVEGVGFAHVSAMAYTSLLEGWSRGALRRRDASALLVHWARAAAARGHGLSVGAVGLGAFGHEPRYRSPEELAEDTALALACGVTRLTLLDLGGVLARKPAEAWLEAFVQTEPAREIPEPSLRVRAIRGALRAVSRAIG